MRDDIGILFNNLAELYKLKQDQLDSLQLKDSDNRHTLESDNTEKLNSSITQYGEIIDKVKVIDYDVSRVIDKICEKAGILPKQFDEMITTDKNPNIVEIKLAQEKIRETSKTLRSERDKLLNQMGKSLNDINKSIDEISNIRSLKGSLDSLDKHK